MADDFPSFEDWKANKKKEGLNLNNASLGITEKEQKKAYETDKKEFEKAQKASSGKPSRKKLTLEQLYAQKVLANVDPLPRTIEDLNALIPIKLEAGAVGAPVTERDRTTQAGSKTIAKILTKQCAAGGGAGGRPTACDWPMMNSDGNGNDCLIHSFLTATCPNFRRLELHHKRQFARSFRVDLLPRYPEMKDHLKKEDEDGLTGRARLIENDPETGKLRFLGDEDAQIIISIFQVNLVIFQAERQVKGFVANPAMATLFINIPDNRVFFIYNNGINHFESVKPNDTYYLEFDVNQYDRFHSRKKGESITKDELTTIIEPFLVQTGEETKPQCEYKEGDHVMYNGKEYKIESYKYGDANKDGIVRCKFLDLIHEDGSTMDNIPVGEVEHADAAKKRPHNNAVARATMVAGPGPEHGLKRPHNRTRKPTVLKASVEELVQEFGVSEAGESVEKLVQEFGVSEAGARKALETYPRIDTARNYLRESLIKWIKENSSLTEKEAKDLAESASYRIQSVRELLGPAFINTKSTKRPHNVELPPPSGPIIGKPPRVFKTFVNYLVETKGVDENMARKAIANHTFLDPNDPYNRNETMIKIAEKALNNAKKGGGTRKQRKRVRFTRKASKA